MAHYWKTEVTEEALKFHSVIHKFDIPNAFITVAKELTDIPLFDKIEFDRLDSMREELEKITDYTERRNFKREHYGVDNSDIFDFGLLTQNKAANILVEKEIASRVDIAFANENVVAWAGDGVYISGKLNKPKAYYAKFGFVRETKRNFHPLTNQELRHFKEILKRNEFIHEEQTEVVPLPTYDDLKTKLSISKEELEDEWVFDRETNLNIENGNITTNTYAIDLQNVGTLETITESADDNRLLDIMIKIASKTRRDTNFGVHNLGFDGAGILLALFNHGFRMTDKSSDELNNHEFRTLITGGAHYEYEFRINSVNIRIYDTFKHLLSSVDSLGYTLGLETSKLGYDYNKERKPGYVITEIEQNYIQMDTRIVALSMALFVFNEHVDGMTSASGSMNAYKEMTPEFDELFGNAGTHKHVEQAFDSYNGGWVHLNKSYKGKTLNNLYVYDVNSMYPYVMRKKILPYGKPRAYNGFHKHDQTKELSIYTIHINSITLKQGHPPILKISPFSKPLIKHNKKNNLPYKSIEVESYKDITLVWTSVELETMLENYDIDYKVTKTTTYKAKYGIFDEYIDKYYTIKQNAKSPAEKFSAKIKLNSLYGKFGSGILQRRQHPSNEGGKISYETIEETSDALYPAMASFITAYARQRIQRLFLSQGANSVYCDTDSVHTVQEINESELSKYDLAMSTELGDVKNEINSEDVKRGKYLALKRYRIEFNHTEVVDGVTFNKTKSAMGGIPASNRYMITHENFEDGLEVPDKLVKKDVVGGTALIPSTMKLSYTEDATLKLFTEAL